MRGNSHRPCLTKPTFWLGLLVGLWFAQTAFSQALPIPVNTEVPNAFTRRVRYVVLTSGDSQLKTWLPQERDLASDFRRAFGEETDTIPPLIGLAIGADADNTGGSSLGYVGDVTLMLVAPTAPG